MKKLSEAKVRAMRRLYDEKLWGIACIARAYGVKRGTVFDVVHRHTWRHLP